MKTMLRYSFGAVAAALLLMVDGCSGMTEQERGTTTGAVILHLLKRLSSERKVATLMATHSMEAAAIADVVVELRDGSVAGIKRK